MLYIPDDKSPHLDFTSIDPSLGLDVDRTLFMNTDKGRIQFSLEETLSIANFFLLVDAEQLRNTIEEQLDPSADDSDTDESF